MKLTSLRNAFTLGAVSAFGAPTADAMRLAFSLRGTEQVHDEAYIAGYLAGLAAREDATTITDTDGTDFTGVSLDEEPDCGD